GNSFLMHVTDSYYFNNRHVGNGSGYLMVTEEISDCCDAIAEDSEWFDYDESFDGTSGMGCGTVETMNAITPTLSNAGFWVPDNITNTPCNTVSDDNVGLDPTYPVEGTLYKWVDSAWTEYFTPYTYPHPLRDAAVPANAIQGVTIGNLTITENIIAYHREDGLR
ncbi:MAG TPA: hypothetical protein VMW34_04325, partial [Anaerolineales bacterium]|nr:hypothetical protein [Anaerolineales bacterium]